MGLDITFELDPVLNVESVETKVSSFSMEGKNERLELLLRLPNFPMMGEEGNQSRCWVEMSVTTGSNGKLYATVRANTWGKIYAPLTEFLRDQGLTWQEW